MMQFAPIDLEANALDAVAIRADSFEVSFGSSDKFFAEYGRDGAAYLDHIRARMSSQPGSCVHAWIGATLVGQVELRDGRENPTEGYVNLYYLVPDRRNSRLGPQLERYAVDWLLSRGMTSAALGVSSTNSRALRFYERMGWTAVGPHPKGAHAFLMRKELVRPHAA